MTCRSWIAGAALAALAALAAGACKKSEPVVTRAEPAGDPPPPSPEEKRRRLAVQTPDQALAHSFDYPHEGGRVTRVLVQYVRADAKLDPDHGAVLVETSYPFEFRADDPRRPLGAPDRVVARTPYDCRITRWTSIGNAIDEGRCNYRYGYLGRPRCTLAEIWRRAVTAGAPRDALATIELLVPSEGKPQRWQLAIIDRPRDVHFALEVPDDCERVLEKP